MFGEAELILKVKEPQPEEVARLRPHHTLFTYLHLAPDAELTRGLLESGATCIAYETVEDTRGPPAAAGPDERGGGQDRDAGRARSCSRSRSAAAGVLLGGVPGVAAGKVMVIGGGVVGMNAAFIAIGMQAEVYVYDRNIDRLRELEHILGYRASTVYSSTLEIEQRLPEMDLVIGAVLLHGARAPHVITREQLKLMKKQRRARRRGDRPGRLLRDLAADDPLRPHLRGRRDHALLRREHARRGAGDVHVRADQRDDALRGQAGRPRACTARWPPTRAS